MCQGARKHVSHNSLEEPVLLSRLGNLHHDMHLAPPLCCFICNLLTCSVRQVVSQQGIFV
ncbi:hypothetical protein E2C01_030755 [Portunus trituberculatus]|uniref:Uncharacterized protein n=1 Tax=Portunus trituberculatus TaxID=210409 RepID=A0A5B7ERV3_PORTR|nr:hypothetical protein [Portunus trituberculatus]